MSNSVKRFQTLQADQFSDKMLGFDFASSIFAPNSFRTIGDEDDGFPLAPVAAMDAGSASSANNAPSLVATIPQLANYLINGFWQYNGDIAHRWGSSTITYNINRLNASQQMLAQSALNARREVMSRSAVTWSTATRKRIELHPPIKRAG